ncbi:MAG TPA: bifunctional lysylphosphatidylglycerol flippase/synthetase MprF, partial [Steroidobacteraceae bacterium]|nr:bifunctional lysylphosphatidylglycerol flippase/synthetase MprF [Steroidobacteraceae bacterium]
MGATDKSLMQRIGPWLAFALFIVALLAVDRVLGKYEWHDVLSHLHAIPARAMLFALLLTAGSYLVMTSYDFLAVRFAGGRLPWHTVATASFVAYSVANNVGFAALSGGSVRYRIYSSAGLGGMQVAKVIAFCSATFALGAALLCGLSLLLTPTAGAALHVGSLVAKIAGVLLVLLVAAYVIAAALRRQPLVLRGRTLPLPGLGLSLLQVLVSCVDLCLAAGVLYVLMPGGATGSFLGFLGIYVLASVAGLLSNVPGGLGVFETVLLLLTPDAVPPDQKLAAVLAYRIVYYLLPFLLALCLMLAHEALLKRHLLLRWLGWGEAWLRVVTPHVIGAAVFACGVVLLFSGATPMIDSRMSMLRHIIPLPLLETSHLIGSAVGLGLLFLAQGLQRRLDAAWHLTMLLLLVGAVASLAKGFDYEEALVLLSMAVMLVISRDRFHRKASLFDQRFSPGWLGAILVALLTSLLLAVMSFRHIDYSHDLWWQFALHAEAPRALRAAVLTVVLAGAAGAWLLLRPAPLLPELPDEAALERARQAMNASADTAANLALLGDKNLMFAPDGSGFVMFRPVGRSWIAMGDPVGPMATRAQLVWQFREACDRYAARPVFYQVGAEDLPNYLDAGLTPSKIGEEARVPLGDFSLEGSRRAELRQLHRRAQRDGASCEVVPAAQVPQHIPALRAISDHWLTAKAVAEKGFSLGRFDERYLSRFPCALVRA